MYLVLDRLRDDDDDDVDDDSVNGKIIFATGLKTVYLVTEVEISSAVLFNIHCMCILFGALVGFYKDLKFCISFRNGHTLPDFYYVQNVMTFHCARTHVIIFSP
jgi:hypothetical protein